MEARDVDTFVLTIQELTLLCRFRLLCDDEREDVLDVLDDVTSDREASFPRRFSPAG